MLRSAEVAIVGGGPAGLLLALLIARSGRRPLVIEQNATFERAYRGEGIQPGTRRIFADLGLRERIEGLDLGSPARLSAHLDGRRYEAEFSRFLGADPAARSAFVPQPHLLGILADELRRAGGEIMMGTAFRELLRRDGRVCGLMASTAEEPLTIEAGLVVACDGRSSAVRRALKIDLIAHKLDFDVLWFSAPAAGAHNDTVSVQADGDRVAVAYPSRERRMQVGWIIRKGAYGAWLRRPFDELRAELIALAPPEARAAIEEALSDRDQLSLLPVVSEQAQRWWEPGALLLGDAAHPMSPIAAQGINVAIQDAVVAARRIVPALDDTPALDRALAAIEAERRNPIRRIARQQNALPAAFRRFGASRSLRVAIGGAILLERAGLFGVLAGPVLARFLWGDPPIRADSGPWSVPRM